MTPLIIAPGDAYVRDPALADRDPHNGSDPHPLSPRPGPGVATPRRRGRPVPPELSPRNRRRGAAPSAVEIRLRRPRFSGCVGARPSSTGPGVPPLPRRGTRWRHTSWTVRLAKDAAAVPRVACHASRRVDAAAWRMWASTRTLPSSLLCETWPAVFPSCVGVEDTGRQELVAVLATSPVPFPPSPHPHPHPVPLPLLLSFPLPHPPPSYHHPSP